MKYLAIDVGGTFTKYAIVTEDCEILTKDKTPTIKEPLEEFLQSLENIYQKYKGEVDGIALSMPGIIDSKKGFMYTGGSIRCIDNINIVEMLEKKCQIPVTVENDAKCAALAEVWKGALADCNDGIVMVCGTAVGGAIIHDRNILQGAHNIAGEFSYIITDQEPDLSLDYTFAGNTGVHSLMQIAGKHLGVSAETLTGEKVFSLANQGDVKALTAIKEFVRHLAVQINNLQFIIDPEKVVIGGGISVQPLFIQLIREELRRINAVYPWDLPIPEVDVCRFYNDANLIGAVYVHMKAKEEV